MNIFLPILPEISIFISAIFLLLLGLFIKNIKLIINLAVVTLILAIIFVIYQPIGTAFNNSLVNDEFSKVIKILILLGSLASIIMYHSSRKDLNIDLYEFPILILLATIGMLVMASANDLIAIFIGLELQSLTLYVLASLNRNHLASSEAGLKYFLLGALSSGLLLFGLSYIYGFTGNTNLNLISTTVAPGNIGLIIGIVFVTSGLAFKVSAVPFHMWTPDVYEGSPTSVTSFFALVPKIAALTVFIRFLYVPFINIIEQWQTIIIFLSIASMILGAVAAIGQSNIKRLIAYSSIGHMGYILAGLSTGSNEGIQSSIIYLTIYLVMNLGTFICILMMKRENLFYEKLSDLSGLSKNHPKLALSFLILFFSLAGIPPLAGFFAKFYVFLSVIEAGMYSLAIIGLTTTVVSAYYYLRIIKIIYFDKPNKPFDEIDDWSIKFPLILSTILTLAYFIFPSILIDLIKTITIY
jgi:NADH-quinone oxidoreductase subunit N